MPRFSLKRFVAETWDGADVATFRLCGMDEVGRGAFAGPLVAAAVVLPCGFRHKLLRDSKQLTPAEREKMDVVIRRKALALEVVEIPAAQINLRGLGWANVEAFRRLVDLIDADGYCSDGNLRINARHPVATLVKGDDLVPAISAASIVAKVHRDALMRRLHEDAPHYHWHSNKGYGAPVHREAILREGVHAEHRRVFIATMLQTEMDFGMEVTGRVLEAAGATPGPYA